MTDNPTIAVLGAGAIGCYVGGHWAKAGYRVTLIGRERLLGPIASDGLMLRNGASNTHVSDMFCTDHADQLGKADIVLVCVKSTVLGSAIHDLQTYLSPKATVICLMNGIDPIRRMRAALPYHDVLSGMVPYNVVWNGPTCLTRSSKGDIALERTLLTKALQSKVASSVAPVTLHDNIIAVQWGKLLLNLNNPINALSGLLLYDQLSDRGYRRAYAAALKEALGIYKTAGIIPAKVGPIPIRWVQRILRLPNFLFNRVALPIQRLDRHSQTSMAVDLAAGRRTEIDTINGEILALAKEFNMDAPVNAALVRLVKAAEKSGPRQHSATELCLECGL